MKVDNSTNLKVGQNRDSIRISSKDQFTIGSVWVADILHVPFGVRFVFFCMLLLQPHSSRGRVYPRQHRSAQSGEPSGLPLPYGRLVVR